MLRMARTAHRETGLENLCLAGGVALNCVGNGRLLREGPFKRLWIQPAAGDAGGALGVAQLIWHRYCERPRRVTPGRDTMQGALLGPRFSPGEIAAHLGSLRAVYERLERQQLLERVAGLLADEKVVGWFDGRMEFGPRALGARSILGDPRSPRMQAIMNRKIKFRESFRPFAPAVLREHAQEWFDLPRGQDSPYMLLVASLREKQRHSLSRAQEQVMKNDPDLCRRVNVCRSAVPAVTHVDYSARLQTVDASHHPRFYRLIEAFHQRTG